MWKVRFNDDEKRSAIEAKWQNVKQGKWIWSSTHLMYRNDIPSTSILCLLFMSWNFIHLHYTLPASPLHLHLHLPQHVWQAQHHVSKYKQFSLEKRNFFPSRFFSSFFNIISRIKSGSERECLWMGWINLIRCALLSNFSTTFYIHSNITLCMRGVWAAKFRTTPHSPHTKLANWINFQFNGFDII